MDFSLINPSSRVGKEILDAYGREMKKRYGPDAPYGLQYIPEGVDQSDGAFAIGSDDGLAVACGGLRSIQNATCEIKAMFVREERRGAGIGRQMLLFLESLAANMDYRTCRLNTGASQSEALGLYRSSGYRAIPAYNQNPLAAYWFEKSLSR